MNISIGISTVKGNKCSAIDLANELTSFITDSMSFEVAILSQCEEKDAVYENNGFKVYETTEVGLSRSRNFFINNLKGDYIWLIDDDVVISKGCLEKVFHYVKAASFDVFIGKIYCSDKDDYYKNYKARKGVSGLLKVSSIEILTRRKFLLDKKVLYNNDYGVGSKYPCGEENLFLVDLYKNGASVNFIPDVIVYHPCYEKHLNKSSYFECKEMIVPKALLTTKLPFFQSFIYFLRVNILLFSKAKFRFNFFYIHKVFSFLIGKVE